jgi:hypothetical protein
LYERNYQDKPTELQAKNFNLMMQEGGRTPGVAALSQAASVNGWYSSTAEGVQYRGHRYGKGLYDDRLPLTLLFIWMFIALVLGAMKSSGLIKYGCASGGDSETIHPSSKEQKPNKEEEEEVLKENNNKKDEDTYPERLMKGASHHVGYVAFLFLFLPFVLSSNMFVSIGTTKAERLMYLPVLGYCILITYVLSDDGTSDINSTDLSDNSKKVDDHEVKKKKDESDEKKNESIAASPKRRRSNYWLSYSKKLVFLLLTLGYTRRSLIRASQWQSTLTLWQSSYQTGSSLGYVPAHTLQVILSTHTFCQYIYILFGWEIRFPSFSFFRLYIALTIVNVKC